MKSLLALAIAIVLPMKVSGQTPASPASALGSIEVLVQNSNGVAVPDVRVFVKGKAYADTELHRDAAGHWVEPAPNEETSATTVTDGNGRATVSNLRAGPYHVTVSRIGYIHVNAERLASSRYETDALIGDKSIASGFPVTFGAHQLHAVFSVRMEREGVIAGRVHDSDGNARPNAAVSILKMYYPDGSPHLDTVASALTNDLGEYRASGLAAGKYFVSAESIFSNGGSVDSRVVPRNIYYPDSRELRYADVVEVHEGSIITGIDFNSGVPQSGVTISGIVINPFPGGARYSNGYLLRTTNIILVPVGEGLIDAPSINLLSPLSGDATQFPFRFLNVPRGAYDLYATFTDSTTQDQEHEPGYYSVVSRIDVGDQNLPAIRLTLESGSEIHGRVLFHSEDLKPGTQNSIRSLGSSNAVQFRMITDNIPLQAAFRADFSGQLTDGNTFTIRDVPPGKYQLDSISAVMGFAKDNTFLEDIRQDGSSVYRDGVVTVSGSPVLVDLVFNPDGAAIHGVVSLPNETPGEAISVVLVPDSPYRGNSALYKRTPADTDGSFTFFGVAPGSYRIYAFDLPTHGAERNAQFMSQYEASGIAVTAAKGMNGQGFRVPLIRSSR